ncbi:MAG TPA: hypothetical protein PKA64_08955 [Myxococcota bacterium]|nr:hypothetical protein [Myxococcota bacterium]
MSENKPRNPAFLDAARAFYAEAFEHRRKRDLARSMAEWSDLDDAEQRFTIAHLLYLNLHAQAAQTRALRQLRDLVGDVLDRVDDALQPDDGDEDDEPTLDEEAPVVDVAEVAEAPAEPAPTEAA